jgi:hypothetical protein
LRSIEGACYETGMTEQNATLKEPVRFAGSIPSDPMAIPCGCV